MRGLLACTIAHEVYIEFLSRARLRERCIRCTVSGKRGGLSKPDKLPLDPPLKVVIASAAALAQVAVGPGFSWATPSLEN